MRLADIVDAADLIARVVSDMSYEDYLEAEIPRLAVERKLIVIGEALMQLSRTAPELVASIDDAPSIIGFRNILVHGYEIVDHGIVWDAIQVGLPLLRTQAQKLLDCEDSG
jgi:uncharacterized protein with HEPN domain